MKRRSRNERVCSRQRTRACTHTQALHVYVGRARETPTRHGETETCTRWKKIGGEGRGAGAPVSAFQRRTSAPRLPHTHTTRPRTRARPVSHQAGFSKLRAFDRSSRLSLRSAPPRPLLSSNRTYVRAC